MVNKLKEFMIEVSTYFMVGIKQQASLIVITTLFSMVIPLGVLLMIYMMPIEINKETAIIYISGNILISISNLCITTLAQILIGIRSRNGFEHMATLPISRWSPLIGNLLSSAVSTIPALIVMPIIGMLMFKVKIFINSWVVFIIFISIIIMVGIGSIIGTCSENYQVSQTASMVIMFFVMFGTPSYYAIEAMPKVIQMFQRCLPFYYSLEAMRYLMENGEPNVMVYQNILILCGFLVIVMILTSKFFNWKQRN